MTAKRIKMHKNGGYVCAFKACGDGSIDVKENKIRGYKTVEINGF